MLIVRLLLGSVVGSAITLAACTQAGESLESRDVVRADTVPGALQAATRRFMHSAETESGAAGGDAPQADASGDANAEPRSHVVMQAPDAGCEPVDSDDAGSEPHDPSRAPGTITRITASDFHTCVVLEDERVLCWGMNTLGENNSTIAHKSDAAEWVPWLNGAKELTAGRAHSCFLGSDGNTKCYGINYYGELGDGTTFSTDRPVSVLLEQTPTQLALGQQHTCALMAGGSVQCWGGWSSDPATAEPFAMVGLQDVKAISARDFQSCALLSDQTVKCWQINTHNVTVHAVPNIDHAVSIATGASQVCALLADHTVKCGGVWAPATAVAGITDAVALAAGDYSACALLADGSVRCWGGNSYGELGSGRNEASSEPTTVVGLPDAKLLAGGFGHYCAVLRDDSVQCWGFGLDGELGNGSSSNSNRPVTVLFPRQ